MIGPLIYLRLTSLRNRFVSSAQRLRQPKYLASALVGAAYLYFFIFRRMHPLSGARNGGNPGSPLKLFPTLSPAEVTVLAGTILFAVVLAQIAIAWITPPASPRLKFSEAEIAFLFPAPLTRTRLIHFNLLNTQATILVSSFVLTLVLNRWSAIGGHALTRAAGWWLIISTISLLNAFSQLTVASFFERGGPALRRRVLALIAVLVGATIYSGWQRAEALPPTNWESPADVIPALIRWLDAGPRHWVLLPFQWVCTPFSSLDLRGFFLALGPALIIPGLIYFGIVRLEISFAEGSIAQAEHRAQVRTAWKAGNIRGARVQLKPVRSPFPLRDHGRPELAFFWKNLIAIQSWFSLRILLPMLSAATVIFVLNLQSTRHQHGKFGGIVLAGAAMVAIYTLIAGPQIFRQDLRGDLANSDILKTYPVAGWQIVLGEMLTPALVLSCILWLTELAAGWALSTLGSAAGPLNHTAQGILLGCIGVVVPLLVLLQLLIPNAAALLFPAWQQASRTRGAGFESIGQRLIFVVGQLLAVILALVPAAVLGGLLYFACIGFRVPIGLAIPVATVGIAAVIVGELWVGVWWLGTRFEQFDLARELRP